jgi:hypothetical protein
VATRQVNTSVVQFIYLVTLVWVFKIYNLRNQKNLWFWFLKFELSKSAAPLGSFGFFENFPKKIKIKSVSENQQSQLF